MVSFELHTETHFFTTFAAFIAAVFWFVMCSHMRVGIPFIFVLVVTLVIIVPSTFSMHIHVTIKITNAFELLITTLFRTRKFFVNICITMCWSSLLSKGKHLLHSSQLNFGSLWEYKCLSSDNCVLKYLPHLVQLTIPWSLWWCTFSSLILVNTSSHILHLIFLHLGVGRSTLLGLLEPSVPTCNVAKLFRVCSCNKSSTLIFSFDLPAVTTGDAEVPFELCLRFTGLVTKV